MSNVVELVNLNLNDTKAVDESDATRSELCGDLALGGLTPPKELIKEVLSVAKKPVRVIIRSRAENWTCSEEQFLEQKDAILFCKSCGADGVVFSVITSDNKIDVKKNQELLAIAKPMKCIFGKGMDWLEDKYNALDDLKNLGFDGVLTQGGTGSLNSQMDIVKKMLTHPVAKNGFELILAGGVGLENIQELREIGAQYVHTNNLIRKDRTNDSDYSISEINKMVADFNM